MHLVIRSRIGRGYIHSLVVKRKNLNIPGLSLPNLRPSPSPRLVLLKYLATRFIFP
jgi:hypothetical protein